MGGNSVGEPEQCSPPVCPFFQRFNDGKAGATFKRYVKLLKLVTKNIYFSVADAHAFIFFNFPFRLPLQRSSPSSVINLYTGF